ncbi:MAG: hypothetical protein ABSA39_01860 [Edaphobacter sp.]
MKRPVGLVLSAIVLGLAAFFLLLTTALMVFAGILARNQPSISAAPHFVTYLMLALSVFYSALSVWAILTVIGILRLRSWARYSILIIGGGLAVIGCFAALFTVLGRTMMSRLPTQQPAVDPHVMTAVFLFLAAFYLLIAAVGIWWLVYFNLRPVREIFQNPNALLSSDAATSVRLSRVPTAIKIIGGFLLFSAIMCLFCILLPFPAFILGFILTPTATHILYLGFAALTATMGYGLLRLKESARILTIAFQIFGCVNIGLATLPWYQAQFRLYMTQITSSMLAFPTQPQTFAYGRTFILLSCLWCLIIYGVVIWLLHRHRAAFKTPPSLPPTMLEA